MSEDKKFRQAWAEYKREWRRSVSSFDSPDDNAKLIALRAFKAGWEASKKNLKRLSEQ